MTGVQLSEEILGTTLDGVQELWFDATDEPGIPAREAIGLACGQHTVLIRALTDTSEIAVTLGALECTEPEHRIDDASDDPRYRRFIGKAIRNWWQAINERGYSDCFLIALEATSGLCFVSMNNEVSVLAVEGEQFS